MKLETNVKGMGGAAVGFVQEFKQFISRGNVVDLAVGVVIGGAFGGVVTSLVKDVVMPPIGWLTSGHDFSSLKIVLQDLVTKHDPTDPSGVKTLVVTPEVAISYGAFLNTVISFLIVAFAIFLVVKAMSAMKRKEEVAPAAPPAPTPDQVLLTEIRDLLAKKG